MISMTFRQTVLQTHSVTVGMKSVRTEELYTWKHLGTPGVRWEHLGTPGAQHMKPILKPMVSFLEAARQLHWQ